MSAISCSALTRLSWQTEQVSLRMQKPVDQSWFYRALVPVLFIVTVLASRSCCMKEVGEGGESFMGRSSMPCCWALMGSPHPLFLRRFEHFLFVSVILIYLSSSRSGWTPEGRIEPGISFCRCRLVRWWLRCFASFDGWSVRWIR